MYGIRIMDYFVIPVVTVGLLLVFAIPLFASGQITIEQDYWVDWKLTENELEECRESKTPSCAACECKESASYLFLWVLGAIFYISSLIYFNRKEAKLTQIRKEINEREIKHKKK